MARAADDERREVAAALRAIDVPTKVEKTEHPEKTAAWYELLCEAVGGKRDPWYGIKALANRLADLIEPSCNREALLALAEEMAEVTCDNRGELPISLGDVHGLARRIREACWVVES